MIDYDIDPNSVCNCGCDLTYSDVVREVMNKLLVNSDQAQHIIDKSSFTG